VFAHLQHPGRAGVDAQLATLARLDVDDDRTAGKDGLPMLVSASLHSAEVGHRR
jgi:hypothetical protein